MAFSGALGWWGFPRGLILTPVQVARNIGEMAGRPETWRSVSKFLQKFVRIQAGARLVQSRNQQRPAQSAPPPPVIPTAPQSGGDDRYMPKG